MPLTKGLLRASLAGLDILQAERNATLNQLDALLTALDRALPQAVRALPQGTSRWAHLRTIPGIGPLSGTALVVLARKLVRVAFALHKHDTCFDPAFIGA